MAHESGTVTETNSFPNVTGVPASRALSLIQDRLEAVGITEARYEATLLLLSALEVTRERLLVDRELVISAAASDRIQSMVQRRVRFEPLQYVLGSTEFYGREFRVDESVLIPRPETELLVEQALAFAREQKLVAPRVLDIGTGSGILAITIAAELPGAEVVATDISVDALQVAQANAEHLGVAERINFGQCSLADDVNGQFDIVVANPPYVLTGFLDGDTVQPELAHEPRVALDGGADGMNVYRPLIAALSGLLRETSIAVVEIDPPVTANCLAEARFHFPGSTIEVLTDLSGLERALVIEHS
jgi:release factor glutamine methyltransferase